MRITACIALLSLLVAPAWGQSAAPPSAAATAEFAAYIKHSDYQAGLVAAAKAQTKQAPGECTAATYQPTGQVSVLDPPHFNAGQLVSGVWTERIEATGCGPMRALNVLTIARPDTTPQFVSVMPGDTHTDPNMQKNALEYAQAIAVRAAPPGCRQLAFVDTKFDGFSGLPSAEVTDGRESRPWREIWTLAACGGLYDVHLVFTPNARGTALAGDNPVKHPG